MGPYEFRVRTGLLPTSAPTVELVSPDVPSVCGADPGARRGHAVLPLGVRGNWVGIDAAQRTVIGRTLWAAFGGNGPFDRSLADLVEARVRLDNTIRGLCATFGIRLGIGQGERFLARIQVAAAVPGLGEAVASLLRAREGFVAEIGQLDRQLKAISTASPVCQALMSIPGVGVQTSAAFAAAVDDASRFKRSRTAGAYFGLVPRRHQSGELDWTGRITKQGDSTVRKLLYEAANSILTRTKQSFALKTWALKIAKRRGLRKARVALARRLAVIMHAMLRDGTLFEA